MNKKLKSVFAVVKATVLALVPAVLSAVIQRVWQQEGSWLIFWTLLVSVLLIALGLAVWYVWPVGPEGRRSVKWRYALFVGTYSLFLMMVWNESVGPRLSSSLVGSEIDTLINRHRWITYDPLDYDPSANPNPSIEHIGKELSWIRNAGFDGIITFTCRGNFSLIPQLAKSRGLFVIAGVWDPTDRNEIASAISQRNHVDAYSVGHNGLGWLYAYHDLEDATREIRFHTGRPVSTTEVLAFYLADERLLEVGDWLFPDAHVSIKDSGGTTFIASASRDAKQTFQMARLIADVKERKKKPILLKMVTYPVRGIFNSSVEEQASFFASLLENRRDVQPSIPIGVAISFHSAFDTPWKKRWPFYPWDPYTGLLDSAGAPRLAVKEIMAR